jgi:hypothetical protein
VIITFMVLFIYKLRRFRLLKENSDSEYLNVHDKESNEEPDNPPLTTTTACAAKLKSFTEVPGVDACALSTNVEEQNSRACLVAVTSNTRHSECILSLCSLQANRIQSVS